MTDADHRALVKQFVIERDPALLSLDEDKIRRHMAKWNIKTPENLNVFDLKVAEFERGGGPALVLLGTAVVIGAFAFWGVVATCT